MADRGLSPGAPGRRPCPLCGASARLRAEGLPGYQEPATFAVAACAACDTAFIPAAGVDPGPLYDLIYAQVERIPGYERYHRYAQGVLRARDPLRYLADVEDMYWAVARYLAERDDPRALRLIEVGSGIGYLTYALARRGLNIKGIDHSETAVARARRVYGNHYECVDASELARRGPQRYDVVIMTEVLEHVKDPAGILAALGAVLAPGGEVVVTTPNKSYHPPEAVWATDLPPVHLWWFSEASLRFLARRLGYQVRFLDFRAYNRTHYCLPPREERAGAHRPPILDPDGRVRGDRAVSGAMRQLRTIARAAGVTGAVRSLQARMATALAGSNRPRPTLCAVFSKDPNQAEEIRCVAQTG